jgi:hypothetical protein
MYRTPRNLARIIVVCCLLTTGVFGCVCSSPAPNYSRIGRGERVFLGTVVAIEAVEANSSTPAGSKKNRFRVDESFWGVQSAGVDLLTGNSDCDWEFNVGEQYLIFTDSSSWMQACTPSRSVSGASAIIPELRAIRDRERHSQIFGTVTQYRMPLHPDYRSEEPVGPLNGVRIVARDKFGRATATMTDEEGVFRFKNLEAGEYEVAAIPSGKFESAFPPSKLKVTATDCYEETLWIYPKTTIVGTVLDPLGNETVYSDVTLIPVESTPPKHARFEGPGNFVDHSGEFKLEHLTPGDYVLATDDNILGGRAYFPAGADRIVAATVHVQEGDEQRLNLRLNERPGNLTVLFSVGWGNGTLARAAYVEISDLQGKKITLKTDESGHVQGKVLPGDQIHVVMTCQKLEQQEAPRFVVPSSIRGGQELRFLLPQSPCKQLYEPE